MTEESMDPVDHYDAAGEDEWERLASTFTARSEFRVTTDYLAAELPGPASEGAGDDPRILDAGGGAGRYTAWLAERGYDVALVDPSEGQLAVAREKLAERGLNAAVDVERGDVRDLAFADDSFDGVLCTGGPLSHVLDAGERARATRELRRVARPGAPVFVSVMGRLAVLEEIILRHDLDDGHGLLLPLARTGDYTAELAESALEDPSWVECHFFRADELETLCADAGLDVEALVGLEGIPSNLHHRLEALTDDAERTLRALVDDLREDRSVADVSEHILAVCRA